MDSSFVGYWETPTFTPGNTEFLHISESGRCVHEILMHKDSSKYTYMRVWLKYLEGDSYQVSPTPDASRSWNIRMYMKKQDLVMINSNASFPFRRVVESDIPERFHTRLAQSHDIMDKKEA